MATLYEKVYGSLAASRVGSSMGAAVEGWLPQRIEETYGYLDSLQSYTHYVNRGITWKRLPGTTEDGIERQKLMCRAIIEKQDRITAEDLYRATVDITDLDKMWFMTQPEDLQVMRYMKSGVPPVEVGRLTTWFGCNFARATHPIGLINAGAPEEAVRDIQDIGRLYFASTDDALAWAGVYVAAIAEAASPSATIESVVAAARGFASAPMQREIDRALEIAGKLGDYKEMRGEFYKYYDITGVHYAFAKANETVSKALALFVWTKGDAELSITAGVNFGRDTDCLAASAGGLSGAFSGIGTVPQEWVEQVDRATVENPYTSVVCTIKDDADGLYAALQSRARKIRELLPILEG